MKVRRMTAAILTSLALVGGLATPASAVDSQALAKGLRHLNKVAKETRSKSCTTWLNLWGRFSYKKAVEDLTGLRTPVTHAQLEEALRRNKAAREARIKDYSVELGGSHEWEGNQKTEFDRVADATGKLFIEKAEKCELLSD